jgi:hypothetical protein
MDRNTRAHFERIIALAHNHLTDVQVLQNDVAQNRAILQVRGKYNELDVWLKEVFTSSGRLYSYYLLRSGFVIVGFDNYPDLIALKMKKTIGKDYHGRGKKSVNLTPEFDAEEFLDTLDQLANS